MAINLQGFVDKIVDHQFEQLSQTPEELAMRGAATKLAVSQLGDLLIAKEEKYYARIRELEADGDDEVSGSTKHAKLIASLQKRLDALQA